MSEPSIAIDWTAAAINQTVSELYTLDKNCKITQLVKTRFNVLDAFLSFLASLHIVHQKWRKIPLALGYVQEGSLQLLGLSQLEITNIKKCKNTVQRTNLLGKVLITKKLEITVNQRASHKTDTEEFSERSTRVKKNMLPAELDKIAAAITYRAKVQQLEKITTALKCCDVTAFKTALESTEPDFEEIWSLVCRHKLPKAVLYECIEMLLVKTVVQLPKCKIASVLESAAKLLRQTDEKVARRIEDIAAISTMLLAYPFEFHKLSPIEIVTIAEFSQNQLSEKRLQPVHTTHYFSHDVTALPRDIIIDFEKKRIVVLSKTAHSVLQASGASKKATDAIMIALKKLNEVEAKVAANSEQCVRLVNKAGIPDHPDSVEFDLEKRFNGDVHAIVSHTSKKGKEKISCIVTAYEGDLNIFTSSVQVQQRLIPEETQKIMEGILQTLSKMHAAGYVHNDIKAPNVLYKHNEKKELQAKLTDFGLSYSIKTPRPTRQYGSICYSAPEVLLCKGRLKSKVEQGQAEDMYALGALMYELLHKEELPWIDTLSKCTSLDQKTIKGIVIQQKMIGKVLQKEMDIETNPKRKQQLACIQALLEPNPKKRMKVDALALELSRAMRFGG